MFCTLPVENRNFLCFFGYYLDLMPRPKKKEQRECKRKVTTIPEMFRLLAIIYRRL